MCVSSFDGFIDPSRPGFWKPDIDGVEGSGLEPQLNRGGGDLTGIVGCFKGTVDEDEAFRVEEKSWDR